MLQRVRELVTGVLDLVVPQQLHAQEFPGRVALLVKGERARVRDALVRFVYHGPIIKDTVEACRASARACVEQGKREDRLWTWLAQLRQTPAHEWNRFYASSAALLLPRGFQPTPGKISDAVTRVIDLLYGETATGSAADVLAERHLPVAARRFPRAYPLEPGLWRNLLDDDRAFA